MLFSTRSVLLSIRLFIVLFLNHLPIRLSLIQSVLLLRKVKKSLKKKRSFFAIVLLCFVFFHSFFFIFRLFVRFCQFILIYLLYFISSRFVFKPFFSVYNFCLFQSQQRCSRFFDCQRLDMFSSFRVVYFVFVARGRTHTLCRVQLRRKNKIAIIIDDNKESTRFRR